MTSGPYRLVRHPGYLSNLLCLAGIGLALSSLVGLGLTLFVVPLIVRCIERKEEMLNTELGQEYRRYRQQTRWRLIPYIFRSKRRLIDGQQLLCLSETKALERV